MPGMAREYAAGNSRGPGWCELRGPSIGRWVGQLQAGRQAGSGMARSRAMARVNWVSHGQRWERCRVRRRAERVIRPTRAKTRRLRVLVVTVGSPRPTRAVQRARLCAITWTASQAALAAKRPEGRWFSPTPYLKSRMAFSSSAWRCRPAGIRPSRTRFEARKSPKRLERPPSREIPQSAPPRPGDGMISPGVQTAKLRFAKGSLWQE